MWWSSELNSPIPAHFSSLILRCRCLLLPSPVWPCPGYLDSWPNIPGSCAILFFTVLDFTFTIRHIHNWTSFPLCPCLFILSGAISNCPPLFPSSILDTFCPAGLIFRCHIFLPFYTLHVVLVASILEWLAIPSSSEPCFVRTLDYDPSVLGGPAWLGS